MARAKVEQQTANGTTMVVMVGLSIAFLLFIAFLNVVKTGNIFSEANLLYAALVFYAGAGALYLGFGITGTDSYIKFASLATWAGLMANTAAVAHRWYEAGHPPFASIYEMLLSFVWTLAALTLIAEKRYGVKVIGTVTMPVAIVGVVLMELLPSEVRPLVPALQSTWLHVHVTLAMLAYAACALSFALAMMFLIQDKMKTEIFLTATSIFTVGIYGAILTRFEKWGGFNVVAWDAQNKTEVFISRGVRLFVTIPDLGWLMLLVFAAVAVPLVLSIAGQVRKNEALVAIANRAVFVSILLQSLALIFFLVRVRAGQYPSLDAEGLYATALPASPFILSALGRRNFRQPALSVDALAPRRSRAPSARCRRARSHHVQDDLHRFPFAHPDDRRRRLLGQPGLGILLELGSQRDVGGDYLAGLCRIPAHANHPRMARTPCRLLRHPRFRCGHVYLLRGDVLTPRIARICLRLRTK